MRSVRCAIVKVGMWKRAIEISKACNQEPLLDVCDWVITVCLDWRNARGVRWQLSSVWWAAIEGRRIRA